MCNINWLNIIHLDLFHNNNYIDSCYTPCNVPNYLCWLVWHLQGIVVAMKLELIECGSSGEDAVTIQ